MAETKVFQAWHRIEITRRLGHLKEIEEKVEREMKKIKVEGKDEKGRWVPIS